MKKSEQYILFGIGVIIIFLGIFSFLYMERRFSPSFHVKPSNSPTSISYIIIHVAGDVKRPGVYRLPIGARVYEAIDRAGGSLPDADMDSLNLARVLKDGEKIFVPKRALAQTSLKTADNRLDINTMDKESLMRFPGIGEKLAERIIKYREAHGPFRDIDELKNVSGIGDKKLKNIKDYLNSSQKK